MINVKIVKAKYRADFKVYLVENEFEQKNAHVLIGSRLVDEAEIADMNIFVTARKDEAEIWITRGNFPIRVPRSARG